jgi:hypothetical protein
VTLRPGWTRTGKGLKSVRRSGHRINGKNNNF